MDTEEYRLRADCAKIHRLETVAEAAEAYLKSFWSASDEVTAMAEGALRAALRAAGYLTEEIT